jgi:hypothetical protein
MLNQVGLDLSARQVVASNATDILEMLRKTGSGVMPPPPLQHWTSAQIDLFARWDDEGDPE